MAGSATVLSSPGTSGISTSVWTWTDPLTLPTSGTYTIRIDPEPTAVGSATLTLHDIPADAQFTVVPGAEPVTVTTAVPGQNAFVTMEGEAG